MLSVYLAALDTEEDRVKLAEVYEKHKPVMAQIYSK